jgi:hypothetical protein
MNTRSVLATLATALLSTLPAAGASIEVWSRPLPPEVKVTGAHFEADEKTGRAVVVVELLDESFETNLFEETVPVPGLVFDRERRQVLYEHDGTSVACATRKKVLFATTYPATAACRLSLENEKATLESGVRSEPGTLSAVRLAVTESAGGR